MRIFIGWLSVIMVPGALLVSTIASGEQSKIGYSLVAGLFAIAAALATTDASTKGDGNG